MTAAVEAMVREFPHLMRPSIIPSTNPNGSPAGAAAAGAAAAGGGDAEEEGQPTMVFDWLVANDYFACR